MIMEDFNGQVRSSTDGYVGVQGGNVWVERNRDCVRLLEFADDSDIIGNTFFKKDGRN